MEGSNFIIIIHQVLELRLREREGLVLSHQEISSSRSDGCPYSGPLRPGLGHCPAALLLHGQDTGAWWGSQGSGTVLECSPSQSSSPSTSGGTASNSEPHCSLPRTPTERGWPFIPPSPVIWGCLPAPNSGKLRGVRGRQE